MAPTHERLDAYECFILEREEGLVEQEQLPEIDRTRKVDLKAVRAGREVLRRVENAMAVASRCLRLVHGLGGADQFVGIGLGIARDEDSDAAGYGEIASFSYVGGADPLDKPSGDESYIVVIAQ